MTVINLTLTEPFHMCRKTEVFTKPDGSGGIVTRLWVGWLRNRSIFRRGKEISFCPQCPDQLKGPPILLSSGNGDYLIKGKAGAWNLCWHTEDRATHRPLLRRNEIRNGLPKQGRKSTNTCNKFSAAHWKFRFHKHLTDNGLKLSMSEK
jgi:hypothetical protein